MQIELSKAESEVMMMQDGSNSTSKSDTNSTPMRGAKSGERRAYERASYLN